MLNDLETNTNVLMSWMHFPIPRDMLQCQTVQAQCNYRAFTR